VTQPAADLVCLSHLRWNFVYQRPNHLMARAARDRRVFFVEEPEYRGTNAHVEATALDGLMIVRPVLPHDVTAAEADSLLRVEIDRFMTSEGIADPWLWYYTPMALRWTADIRASAVIYDCMDELSAFKNADPQLSVLEQQLISRADVVYTGGRSLFDAKRSRHPNCFLFPSSVDGAHFRQAREDLPEPLDQVAIGRPRIGYYGVIDERIDLQLMADVARERPDWNLVMVGPVAKVEESDLPNSDNIHWLGLKTYDELPSYLAGWDVAMMPFALNESTRYISPTKTPEYLSGGRPVVSTPIADVVHPYGDEGLVSVAATSSEFVDAIEAVLAADHRELIGRADRFLATQSWDATWTGMESLIRQLKVARPMPVERVRVAPSQIAPSRPAASHAAPTQQTQAARRARSTVSPPSVGARTTSGRTTEPITTGTSATAGSWRPGR
jgi:UDP-galactopyranose mutase